MKQLFWPFEKTLLKTSGYIKRTPLPDEPANPVTIITGGSDGIGYALARASAELGHDLLLVARNQQNLLNAKSTIETAYPVSVDTLSCDLADPASTQDILLYLSAHKLTPTLLINNVGIGCSGSFADLEEDRITHLINLNISSWTALTRALLPSLLAQKRAGIINISSLAGMVPGPYQALYYASKAYMNSLSQALTHELRTTPIRVTAVAPGPVDTNFHANMGSQSALYLFLQPVLSPESVARSTFRGFATGRRLVVPGILNFLNALIIRVIPHSILLWIMSFLLKPRAPHKTVR